MEGREADLLSDPADTGTQMDPEVGFELLLIQEEEAEHERYGALVEDTGTSGQPHLGVPCRATHLRSSGQGQPYLREMDDLLRSCEGMTGVSLGSHLSPRYTDTNLGGSALSQAHLGGRDAMTGRCVGETGNPLQPHLSTTANTNTQLDGPRTQHQTHRQDMDLDGSRSATGASDQAHLPLTSAGTQLSGTMAEYQTHLLGMLAMLESCMEEAGMDFDPQEWDTYPSQGQSKPNPNPGLGRTTTLGPMRRRGHGELGSTTQLTSHKPGVCQEDVTGQSGEHIENTKTGIETGGCVDVKADVEGIGVRLRPSRPFLSLDRDLDESGDCEETRARKHVSRVFKGDTEVNLLGDTEPEMGGVVELGGSMEELGVVGAQLEVCIEEVGRLERRKGELLGELLELREEKGENGETEGRSETGEAELMQALRREADGRREARLREVEILRGERGEEESRLRRVRLERQGLQEETRRLKRRLFAVARECAHNQMVLGTQQCEVARLNKEEEELKALVLQLTEEESQLRSAHQSHLSTLQDQITSTQGSSQAPSTQEELSQCRRNSCGDIQQYIQGGRKALEERYEPMLLALLKRREGTSEGLVKAREQTQELRARLGPLREESQRLGLQRACLEERLKLMERQRREDVEQYKNTVDRMEESSRELKMELQIQKRKTKEMEELKDSLTKQLSLYRGIIEDCSKCDLTAEKEKT